MVFDCARAAGPAAHTIATNAANHIDLAGDCLILDVSVISLASSICVKVLDSAS